MEDGVAAPVAAVVMAAHGEKDKLLRIPDGVVAKRDLIEDRENDDDGDNAKRQGEDGHGGEAGSAGEQAEGVHEVAKDGVEPTKEGETARGFVGERGHSNTSG